MKREHIFGLAVLLTATWSAVAMGGWFGGRDKDPRQPGKHRYTDMPRGQLVVGELSCGSRNEWQVGGRRLVLRRDCRIEIMGRRVTELQPAARAWVLGTTVGDAVVVRQVRVRGAAPAAEPMDEERLGIVRSEVNPHVGVGTIEGIE